MSTYVLTTARAGGLIQRKEIDGTELSSELKKFLASPKAQTFIVNKVTDEIKENAA